MIITKVDHIELVVRNLEESVKFYTKKLGVPVVTQSPHHGRSVELRVGEVVIELHEVGDAGNVDEIPGLNHIAFEVEDEDTAFRELETMGIQFEGEPGIYDPSWEEDRLKGRKVANVRDPNGWRIQLIGASN